MIPYVQQIIFNSINEILDFLILNSKKTNSEYESVKLYGNSKLILSILKCVISDYDYITLASIDIVAAEIDPICKDLYVLSLTEQNELFIQPAYNGETLYLNEAKFAIVQDDVSCEVMKQFLPNDLSNIVIGKILKNNQK